MMLRSYSSKDAGPRAAGTAGMGTPSGYLLTACEEYARAMSALWNRLHHTRDCSRPMHGRCLD